MSAGSAPTCSRSPSSLPTRWRGSTPPASVIAGDLNATLDHALLRRLIGTGYRDVAATRGRGWAPTWPVGRPVPPVTIDHVLVDRRAGVRSFGTYRITGTDHRAVRADLVLPA